MMKNLFRRGAGGARFVHPLQPALRTAILASGFEENRRVRVFGDGWNEQAERFQPDVVAASLRVLRALARERVEIPGAVVAFTYEGESPLAPEDRDWLWRAFGVPVFEQVLGPGNELLAMECEAHDGLHLMGQMKDVESEEGHCACGRAGLKIVTRNAAAMSVSA